MSKETAVEPTAAEVVLANAAPQALQMMDMLDIHVSDPAEASLKIAMALAYAETPEQLDQAGQVQSFDDHLGEGFIIRNVDYYPTSFADQALPIFAVCDCVTADGELVTLSTGSTGVVISIARVMKRQWNNIPWKVVRSDTPTSSGYYPHRLVKA
jgi:hypothetical protein